MTLQWKEPPPETKTGYGHRWAPVAAELQEHPGEWAIVQNDVSQTNGYTTAASIRHGRLAGFAAGEFEARFVRTGEERGRYARGDVYARYVGSVS